MRYLLDTCIVSEFRKSIPNQKVVDFINSKIENDFFLSVLTIGELFKGIEKVDNDFKRKELSDWVQYDLIGRFRDRIIDIDFNICKQWGIFSGRLVRQGISAPLIDNLLASTCVVYDLILVTRNVKDIKIEQCQIINPFE